MSNSTRIDDIARFFTRDPARPTHCARVLCACLHVLDGNPEDKPYAMDVPSSTPQHSDTYEHIRGRYHAYLNACVAFLSTPRSRAEFVLLDASISVCTCAIPSYGGPLAELHQFTRSRLFTFNDFMEALVRHLGGILGSAVVTKTVSGVSASGGLKKNARKHSGHRLWPVDTRELIPLGLEQSVKGYTLSFQLCRHASFPDTLVVNQLISIFGGLVLRFILVTEPEWPLRISVLGIGVISERSDTRGHPVRLEMETSWRHTIGVILLFAQTVAGEGHRYPHDVGQFSCRIVRTWEQDGITRQGNGGLLYVCNMLLENLPSFREGTTLFTEVLMTRLTLLASANAAILYCYRMAKEEELAPYHPEILRLRTEVNAMMEDPTYFAFGWYCYASELRHCCAPGCNETFTTLGRPFARCTGCRVVRYCSRDCQKRGWRDTRAPHKDVCAKLRMLRERTNFSQDKIADRAGDYVPFVAACKADKESEAVAFASAKHLYKLAMMRQDTDVHCVPEAYKAMFAEWKNGAK